MWDESSKKLIQNNSIFLFTVGPVQSFISQARKTQDFYMGSFIISFLTFKAMEVIIDKWGPTNIVYPDLYKQPLMDLWIRNILSITPLDFDEISIQLPTIPNRFVAFLPTTVEDEIRKIAKDMIKNIKKVVCAIFEIFQKEFDVDIEIAKHKIESQLSEFPEIYWVSIPWKISGNDISINDLEDYLETDFLEKWKGLWKFAAQNSEFSPNIGLLYELLYSILEKSMGARKNLRNFKQPNEKENGRKCSLCGERDVIFFRETKNKNKFTRFNKPVIDLTSKLPLKFLSNGEGLCAVCFLKRILGTYLGQEVMPSFKNMAFPSTAEVASADFKEKALNTLAYSKYLEKFREITKDNLPDVQPLPKIYKSFQYKSNLEGSWFYEENLTEENFEEEIGVQVKEDEIKELRGFLKKITSEIGKPNPYYAIIHLDGDNMGKWLSGELLPDINNAYNSNVWKKIKDKTFIDGIKKYTPRKFLTPAVHASISTALKNYTIEFVRNIVEMEYLGKLIYAGGDDLLAIANLKDMFDIMERLRWAFSGNINIRGGKIEIDLNNSTGFVEKDGRLILTMGPKATASTGVVIAHYKAPLNIVIKKVFEMGARAKSAGKNGFAVCLMKRSGEERIAKAKWNYNGINTIEILKYVTKAFYKRNENGYIAKSFIQKIAMEFARLKDENGKFSGTRTIEDIFSRELFRLLYRSYSPPEGRRVVEEDKNRFINELHERMTKLFIDIAGDMDNFINLCNIAIFVHNTED